jgi:hypothetical protein
VLYIRERAEVGLKYYGCDYPAAAAKITEFSIKDTNQLGEK